MEQPMLESLDKLEEIMERGMLKVCNATCGAPVQMMSSPDIDGKWDEFLEHYVGDAVALVNDYPMAALGFAAYLGMAVAHQWDADWPHYKDKHYKSYYGDRGFDNMDDHIVGDILHLDASRAGKLSGALMSCCQAILDLFRHEGIELNTEYGFYALVRAFSVMYKVGVGIELSRLGYKKQPAQLQ